MASRDADLFVAALNALGLAARSDRRGTILYDSLRRRYMSFRDGELEGASPPPADLSEFLKVRYFEHYSFPNDYKIIDNPFCGMSREELELKLAVMGK